MRVLTSVFACCLVLGWSAFALADEPASKDVSSKKVSADEIRRLVDQLGHEEFAKRVAARKQLEAIGERALPLLRKAMDSAGDPEIRSAARAIIETSEQKNSGVLRVFEGHANRVNCVALRADGKRALSASWDGGLRYWDLEKSQLIHEMRSATRTIDSVAISPDGKRGLTGGSDITMRVWDLEAGKELRSFPKAGQWDVAFSPDGKEALGTGSDGCARLYDLDTGQELLIIEARKGGRVWTAAFTPDGKQAVTGGSPEEVNGSTEAFAKLWDLATGKEIRQFRGHTKDIRRVAVSRDGKRLLTGSFDGTMRLWNMQTADELKRFDGPGHFVEAVAFTPDGKKAVCCYGPRAYEAIFDSDPRCTLRLWDLTSGKELRPFRGHTAPVLSLALSADGRFLVSGSADNTMRVWQMAK